jgi:hypothetical protein
LSSFTDVVVVARATFVLFQIQIQYDFVISSSVVGHHRSSLVPFDTFAKINQLVCKEKLDE